MKTRTKLITALFVIIAAFVIYQRNFNPNNFNDLSVEEISAIYSEGCAERDNTIVPCTWYAEADSPMPAMLAGILDGAYLTGESFIDLARLTWNYTHDLEYRRQTNEMLAMMWENRYEVYEELKIGLKNYGETLAGHKGALEAEYEFGKLVFEAGITLVGVGSATKVNKGLTTINKGKWLTRLEKIIRISKSCKPCAKLFRQSGRLRKSMLKHNLPEVQRLLNKEWKASGKTWKVFIDDYEAHHVIPVDMLDKSFGLKYYYNNGGKFSFNSIENGIFVKKVAKGGGHATHRRYNNNVSNLINDIYTDLIDNDVPTKLKVKEFDKRLEMMVSTIKDDIIVKCQRDNIKINHIFD